MTTQKAEKDRNLSYAILTQQRPVGVVLRLVSMTKYIDHRKTKAFTPIGVKALAFSSKWVAELPLEVVVMFPTSQIHDDN